MNLNPVILAIPIFLTLIGIELLYEVLTKKRTYRLNDAITNVNLGSLDQVTGVFFKLIKIGIYTLVYEWACIFALPKNTWTFLILFILYDLCYYWSHRMAHEISLFWGGHVVHHQSEDFNLSVALRQSSTSFLWSFPFYLPLAILGFHPVQLVFVGGLNLIYQFWIHTEHVDRLPSWLEAVINTPSHHRVHHARNPKYIDKNYAGVFIVWDRLFGTFKAEEERPTYGITKPLNSWNPLYANVAHYVDLWRYTKATTNWRDRFRILFNPPGWMPAEMGGYQGAKAVAADFAKYDRNSTSRSIRLYIFLQFLAVLAVNAYFLFQYQSFNATQTTLLAIWIVLSTMFLGMYFESNSRWFVGSEVLRLLALPAMAAGLFGHGASVIWLTVVFALGSLVFFIAQAKPADAPSSVA